MTSIDSLNVPVSSEIWNLLIKENVLKKVTN